MLFPNPIRAISRTSALAALAFLAVSAGGTAHAASVWASFGPDGKLVYASDAKGNRIMDFSSAGYRQGGVALPNVPVAATLSPTGLDDTAAIQAAIDAVSLLPQDASGARGAVLLNPGTYNISSTININASGVVLRGSGSSGASRSTINMTGATGFLAVSVMGSGSYELSNTASFINQYVPSGSTTVTVTDAAGFAVGDEVLVQRTVTAAWVHFVGMDTLVRDGLPQTWIAPGTQFNTDRVIAAINGNSLVLDAPLTDSFDPLYLGNPPGTISRYA